MDLWYKHTSAARPWVDRLPSEYLADHVRLSTLSLEKPRRPERLAQALASVPGIERVLVYAGGYPDRDWERPEQIAARLPAEWHEGVFHKNAQEFS
jgi:hypothetical protein